MAKTKANKRITVRLVDLHTGTKTKHFATEGYAHRWIKDNSPFGADSTRHNPQHAVTQDCLLNLLVKGTTLDAIFAATPIATSQPTSAKGIARKEAKDALVRLVYKYAKNDVDAEALLAAMEAQFVLYAKPPKQEK